MGIGQVMGVHWKALGYADVEALVAEARSGVAGQVRLMVRFSAGLVLLPALEGRDWRRFARGYNGAGFARNGYDSRLAAAYRRRCASSRPTPAGSRADRRRNENPGGLRQAGKFSAAGLHVAPPPVSDGSEPPLPAAMLA